ncbi:TetR family transcriptional regulator [Naumannella sp. ID2617S]|uniref:TetR family transcriptional regulator n=1 Tax=Enemella dayhoffiae TaxID=2016507 RepID=UPI001489EE83|nr:TetR family transcriptional regulator [Enemella dayhoffiae]NNG18903.1 TetR family transcriptional regulator [Naumannella sp. ID2617S]
MPLSRRDVVITALGILDRYGLADLSMRRIAAALGVQPGALYHHVANKQTLLAALADEILADLPSPTGTPEAIVTDWAAAFRGALLAHRDGAELVASVQSMRLAEVSPAQHLARLLQPQLSDPQPAAQAVAHLVLGQVIDEQGHAQLVELGVIEPDDSDPATAFAGGVRLLVAGLRETRDHPQN